MDARHWVFILLNFDLLLIIYIINNYPISDKCEIRFRLGHLPTHN